MSGPDIEQTGDRVCLAGRRWAQGFELIKRSQKAIFFVGFRNIMQAKKMHWVPDLSHRSPDFNSWPMNFCCGGGSCPQSSELPLSSGFGEAWSECGLKTRWENGGILDSLKRLGECWSEFTRIQWQNTCKGTQHIELNNWWLDAWPWSGVVFSTPSYLLLRSAYLNLHNLHLHTGAFCLSSLIGFLYTAYHHLICLVFTFFTCLSAS